MHGQKKIKINNFITLGCHFVHRRITYRYNNHNGIVSV